MLFDRKVQLARNIWENNMEQLVAITQVLANLGIFLGGAGVIWYVSMYRDKDKNK